MQEYEFTLKFSLGDEASDPESYIERLAEAGCDDALIGIGQQGRIALNFNRESDSAWEAVYSAIKDVKRAIPNAELIEASPDLVGVSDIAEVFGVTRQNIRKIIGANKAVFPTPIHDGRSAIWHLSNILSWSKKENRYPIDESLLDVAQANMKLNITKESLKIDIDSEMRSVLAV